MPAEQKQQPADHGGQAGYNPTGVDSPSLLLQDDQEKKAGQPLSNNTEYRPPVQPPEQRPRPNSNVVIPPCTSSNHENADTPWKLMRLQPGWLICLWLTLTIVDICVGVSSILYLLRHDETISDKVSISYGSLGDIFTSIYRLLVIALCVRFMFALLKASPTAEQVEDFDLGPDYEALQENGRKGAHYSCSQVCAYFFKELKMNQFTIAAVLCAVHHFYDAALLWIAVINGANAWYILRGFAFFLGAFSIPIPGVCFNQFKIYQEKERRMNNEAPDENDTTTQKSKLFVIQQTVFADSGVRFLLFVVGMLCELFKFCCVPVLNHDVVMTRQNIVYHCQTVSCNVRPDFVLNEAVFRMFVGMALFNNLVLLGSVLSEEIHPDTSLTNMTKIMNPLCFIALLILLLFDVRMFDSYWTNEFRVFNWLWIAIHISGILMILRLLCCHLYRLNHLIHYGTYKDRSIKLAKSLFIEGLLLTAFAFMSVLFASLDQEILQNIGSVDNLRYWRQWSMILYFMLQLPALAMANRVQQYDSSKHHNRQLGDGKYFTAGFRRCFVWISVINLYDLVHSFVSEAREYSEVTNGEAFDDDSIEHTNLGLYEWSFSFSFTVSHLILWSLCGCIEFIDKYDEQRKNAEQRNNADGGGIVAIAIANGNQKKAIARGNSDDVQIRRKSAPSSVADDKVDDDDDDDDAASNNNYNAKKGSPAGRPKSFSGSKAC